MLVNSIFSFTQNVFYPSQKTNFNFSVTFILTSANALNLDKSKNLSFGKELEKGCAVVDEVFTNIVLSLTASVR